MITVYASAEDLLRKAGARVTQSRVSVLRALLEAPRALTHHEIEQRVRRMHHVDRVTVYRVLEWLVESQLAHRIASDDRVWRFNAAAGGAHDDNHVHFKCNHCGEVTCLERAHPSRRVALPKGYRQQRVEITVRGLCAECAC